MKNQNYRNTITANVSATEAFDKICRVSEWWTKSTEGCADAAGDAFTVRFGDTFVDFEVTQMDPVEKIVWEVTDSMISPFTNKKEWNNTQIEWEISSDNGMTTVRMTHVGLVPGVECYEMCQGGWNFYVGLSLFNFLSKNVGLPDQKGNQSV